MGLFDKLTDRQRDVYKFIRICGMTHVRTGPTLIRTRTAS